jgi:hypothetical protein
LADKKAGIVLDAWKLPTFSRHLLDAGYAYNRCEGPTPGTVMLTVETDEANMTALAETIKAANTKAAELRWVNDEMREGDA